MHLFSEPSHLLSKGKMTSVSRSVQISVVCFHPWYSIESRMLAKQLYRPLLEKQPCLCRSPPVAKERWGLALQLQQAWRILHSCPQAGFIIANCFTAKAMFSIGRSLQYKPCPLQRKKMLWCASAFPCHTGQAWERAYCRYRGIGQISAW